MKITTKWIVRSNDGDTVCLNRDLEDTYEESTIQRPDNTTSAAWRELWPVGLEMGNDEYHDRVRFESVRRKDVGVLTASEAWSLERWNRPDRPIKQVEDVTESCRVFLENFAKTDLMGYARVMYIKHSTRPGIAAEYAAIHGEASLFAFIERWENADAPLTLSQVEQAVVQGFVTEVQANEIKQAMKEQRD